jgi:hypothetical protein
MPKIYCEREWVLCRHTKVILKTGIFCPIGDVIKVPGRSRALLAILDEPVLEADTAYVGG